MSRAFAIVNPAWNTTLVGSNHRIEFRIGDFHQFRRPVKIIPAHILAPCWIESSLIADWFPATCPQHQTSVPFRGNRPPLRIGAMLPREDRWTTKSQLLFPWAGLLETALG